MINNSNDFAEVYRNVTPSPGGWLALDLLTASGNRHGVGAWIELVAGGKRQVREVLTASSYLSQSEMTLHFGLGEAAVDEVTVRRAGRGAFRVRGLPKNRRVRLAFAR